MVSIGSPWLWAGFIGFVILMLALDLGVFHRKAHAVSTQEALLWSGLWVAMALLFNLGIYQWFGAKAGTEFLTGYLIEKSLSIDNIFVFVLIFASLKIPSHYQHRVLFWGILSALILRAGMIFAGAALLARFHALIYVFGAFLIVTGIKMFMQRKQHDTGADSWWMQKLRRVLPSTATLHGGHFWAKVDHRWLATPLFTALLLVEFTDVIFALDSIPAIFAVTTDPFIVFTSNIFAILGLRSLFFLLAGMLDRFTYLKVGLAGVLVFVGAKMTLVDFVKLPSAVSLGVIALLIGGSVLASLLWPKPAAASAAHSAASTTR